MVRDLVASGVPAAVGMLEPIDALDAHAFCGGLYAALFENLCEVTHNGPVDSEVEINWAQALRRARLSVLNRHEDDPETHRQWTVPALYVRPERFRLLLANTGAEEDTGNAGGESGAVGISDPDEMRRQLAVAQEVAAALQALPPGTPEALRQRLLTLLGDMPAWMRPDSNGLFV